MPDILTAIGDLHWRQPWWLLLALIPLALPLLAGRRRRGRHDAYADPTLQPWVLVTDGARPGLVRRWRRLAAALAWLLFAVSLAGPRLPLDEASSSPRPRGDLLLLVDVSRSMRAADPRPSRLRRARVEIEELLSRAPGLRIGIVLFAARAHLYVPPTADYAALRFYLAQLDELRLPTAGSRPREALTMAGELLRDSPAAAVVLISDGDWTLDGDEDDWPFPLFVLGIGSDRGGAVPMPGGRWLSHAGRAVVSRMNEAGLRRFARRHGGLYSHAELNDSDWRRLYDEGVARRLPVRADSAADARTSWRELYHWSLVPACMLWLVSLAPARWRSAPAALACLMVGLSTVAPDGARADDTRQQADARYRYKDYAGAYARYRRLDGFEARLGEGAALYRMGRFERAVERFSQAVLLAEDDSQRATALFDLGNGYFQLGDYARAVTVFRDALRYRPDHAASRFNLRFSDALRAEVEARLAEQAGRPGRGPRRARLATGTPLGPGASLSLDDTDDDGKPAAPLPQLPDRRISEYVERGLAHARLAAGGDDTRSQQTGARRLARADARLRMEALGDDQAALWNRLFEMEEGFPAPVETPRAVPGVLPW